MIDDYRKLLLERRPLLDVRAPVEFAKGAFPGAVNIPLLTDDEREQVGKTYQADGPDAAVTTGHRLVSGERRERRLARWLEFARAHPDGALYCFRGGQRSAIVQQWLAEAGVDYPRVRGGYKAMRRYLLEAVERLSASQELVLLGGRTGTGKTEVLVQLDQHIDLEQLANHRGSGFGRRATPQPSPIDFENALAIDWLRLEDGGGCRVVMEDESRCIGRCAIPLPLWERFTRAPVVVLEDAIDNRVRRIRREYVDQQLAEFRAARRTNAFDDFAAHLLESLDRIQRRLGGDRHAELRGMMEQALAEQRDSGATHRHDEWIRRLLLLYYDPMYDYQLERKASRVIFRGEAEAVRTWLQDWTEQSVRTGTS